MKPNKAVKNVCLQEDVINLGNAPIKIEMFEGDAWITYNDCDVFIYSGQQMTFDRSPYPILISPLHKKPIVFNIACYGNEATNNKSPKVGAGALIRTILTTLKG